MDMYVHVCMYVCMYIHMYIYIYVYIYVSVCTYVLGLVVVCKQLISEYACMYACMHACVPDASYARWWTGGGLWRRRRDWQVRRRTLRTLASELGLFWRVSGLLDLQSTLSPLLLLGHVAPVGCTMLS